MAVKKRAGAKKKEKKVIPVGKAFVQATFNNTIVTLTDLQGNVIAWASCGTAGFKGSRSMFQTQFARNPGYHGRYFERCLAPELWEMLLQTYAGPGYPETWDALTAMWTSVHAGGIRSPSMRASVAASRTGRPRAST